MAGLLMNTCTSYCTIVLVAQVYLVGYSSAAYAILSATSNTTQGIHSNQTEYCAVYNSVVSHLPAHLPDPSKYSPVLLTNSSLYDPHGCTRYPEESDVRDKVVLVLRGNCTFYEKAYFAQRANASMLVVLYNESVVYSAPDLTTNSSEDILIPVLLVDNETGAALQAWQNSPSPLYLYEYTPSPVIFDPSGLVLLIIAVTTVLLGAYIANTPFEFLRYGLLIRKGTMRVQQVATGTELDRYTVLGTVVGLVVMVVLVCTLLILLYYFYYPMVYIAMAFYCLVATLSLYLFLSPFVALIPIGEKFRLPLNKIPILRYRPDPLFFVTLLFSVAMVTWWVVERHAVYAWVIQDILGFTFITMLFKRLSIVKPWVIALLMIVLFFYDIFMVFITPFFTSDGVSVMEKAAIGPAGSTERLPLVFTIMRFIYPTHLDQVCSLAQSFSLLGYGDVGIPGLLVTLALNHDLTFRPRNCFRIYFAASGFAYIVGLICTYVALALMKTAQPALLYLVPTTLLSVTFVALFRREFVLFFSGKPRQPKPVTSKDQADSKVQSTNIDTTDTEREGVDSEKSPLVNNIHPV